jgi:hypothetical protein
MTVGGEREDSIFEIARSGEQTLVADDATHDQGLTVADEI